MLTPVYSIHWGLQTRKTYVIPKKGGVGKPVREQQSQKNWKVYSIFVKELEFKKKIGFLLFGKCKSFIFYSEKTCLVLIRLHFSKKTIQ